MKRANFSGIPKQQENLLSNKAMATPRLKEKYTKEIVPALKEKFQYKSVMQVPRIKKICVNKGIGAAVADKKLIDIGVEEITTITGAYADVDRSTTACERQRNFDTGRTLAPHLAEEFGETRDALAAHRNH